MEHNYFMIAAKVLGSLGLLMFGMKLMSDSLQKLAGPQLRHVLASMTTNRFTGMITGALVTATVQSSTATTVMTVSFVSAGLLTLAQAISVIMGANIGTTFTAWIMAMGFNFNLSMLVWPSFVVGCLLISHKRYRYGGDLLYGVAFLLLALFTLSSTGRELDLAHNQSVVAFFSSFDTSSRLTILAFLALGTIVTMMVQSSAAVMAITILLCSTGVLPIYLGLALVLGENIGTTAAANIVALSSGIQARRAAAAHFIFNIVGVAWVLCVFYPFVNMVCWLVGYDPATATPPERISLVLAMFHTTFNVTNTMLLIGFVRYIEKLCCWLITDDKQKAKDEEFKLEYLEANLMNTPEIAVLQAQKETLRFAERTQSMFGMVKQLLTEQDRKKFDALYANIGKEEDNTDHTEYGIARYLTEVSEAHVSDVTKSIIRQMMREISELESIGDACYNLARALHRRQDSKEDFTAKQYENIHEMMALVDEALANMKLVLEKPREEVTIKATSRLEKEINALRNKLKGQNIVDVDNQVYSYSLGSIYVDFLNECEQLGDYVVNVVEAKMGKYN